MIADFKLVNDTTFSLNGIEYRRIFIPKKVSSTGLKVVCAYDSINVIQGNIKYTNVIINGVNHTTLKETISVLKDLLFVFGLKGEKGDKGDPGISGGATDHKYFKKVKQTVLYKSNTYNHQASSGATSSGGNSDKPFFTPYTPLNGNKLFEINFLSFLETKVLQPPSGNTTQVGEPTSVGFTVFLKPLNNSVSNNIVLAVFSYTDINLIRNMFFYKPLKNAFFKTKGISDPTDKVSFETHYFLNNVKTQTTMQRPVDLGVLTKDFECTLGVSQGTAYSSQIDPNNKVCQTKIVVNEFYVDFVTD